MNTADKKEMQQLVLSDGPWSVDDKAAILDYCETDVDALARLLPKMLPSLDLPRALLRGRYMRAVAAMEHVGVPIDKAMLGRLTSSWEGLKGRLIEAVDRDYGVFEGSTFKSQKFAAWLATAGIAWPRLTSGVLALDDDTFRLMAKAHPAVAPMRELRSSLSQLRLRDLAVGRDGRNRTLLSPFRAKSSRNAPSNSKFIFGPSVWLRGLIKPVAERALAYVDWSQQEFGIAAALSGDANMQAAYTSGDPYLAFAKQAKAVPADATKATHGPARELYKLCALGVQFGMGEEGLAQRIGRPVIAARDLLHAHRRGYRKFWHWSDAAADQFALNGKLWTVFGWPLHSEAGDGIRTARNFPMQANGAEMMRLAACYMTEAGLTVCAPVHDAFLIEARDVEVETAVSQARRCMAQASADVLGGFELRTDATIYRFPDRYMDTRGETMWNTVMQLLEGECAGAPVECADAPAMRRDVAGVSIISNV
jgi:hypothetical protein